MKTPSFGPSDFPPSGTLVLVAAAISLGLFGCEAPAGDCGGVACLHDAVCRPGEASAQFQSQVPPPSLMTPWHHARASVSFANCSGEAWTRGAFALRPAHVLDESTWGTARVELPVDVPAGRAITVPIDLIAPAAAGAYPFSFAVVHDGVEVFEEPSPIALVEVLPVADCAAPGPRARFRSQRGPAEFVAAGSPLHASVTFANCGTDVWRTDGALRLRSRGAPESAWGPTSVPLPFDVPPAHEVTIPVEGAAPGAPGQYTFAWQLEAEGSWLDEAAPTLTATVLDAWACGAGPPARFISQHAPGTLSPDEDAGVSVRFGNCSGRTWDRGYVLDSALDGRARIWGAGPIALPLPVGSGFAIEIPFHVRAPNAHGTYPYRFGIVTSPAAGDSLLDEPTVPLEIAVRCLPSCGDHNCGGDGCGGSCGNCPNNWICDGAHCQSPELSCGNVQWWNRGINYAYVNQYNWHDTDLNVSGSTPVQLRHDSRLDRTGVYAWGYMPEWTDMVTGDQFKMLHLRPQNQNATNVGHVYPMGFIVGLSGGDTADTGLPTYSTGAHLCIQTIVPYRNAFPAGQDACH